MKTPCGFVDQTLSEIGVAKVGRTDRTVPFSAAQHHLGYPGIIPLEVYCHRHDKEHIVSLGYALGAGLYLIHLTKHKTYLTNGLGRLFLWRVFQLSDGFRLLSLT